jgi:1,4-alpha-glucan branching enzyme
MAEHIGELDLHLFGEGTHSRLFDVLGCHADGDGAVFRVWAPNAEAVTVVGDWNGWDPSREPLSRRDDASGIWEGRADGARPGHTYKYRLRSRFGGASVDKADPFAFQSEIAPATGSRVWTFDHEWGDGEWMASRARRDAAAEPMSIYEMHLGSWRRKDGALPSFRDIADELVAHVHATGFTHVELMPLTEHPFYGSWGYQTTGYFAPTARYGSPDELMLLVDRLHQAGIGVVLDWVPSHFPTDAHGLQLFDGTHLYEHADPRQGFHPEWSSSIFNYGRGEVRSFLVSSAMFWLERYHFDALRVDAVASMLYLDYARQPGEWVPNRHGGKENLDAIVFLRQLNASVHAAGTGVLTIAEESTAWPKVSRPVEDGGLGFSMKWNMGWMHDTLAFWQRDPIHRRHHLDQLTFSLVYAFDENFVLPLSHDEVVYGKGSLLGKMPGDDWQQFANLRALFGWMWTHPGKKLLFMGSEFAQRREWAHEGQLDWQLADAPAHAGVQRLVADLNRVYAAEPALHELDFAGAGFEWVEAHDRERSVIAFLRKARSDAPPVLVVCNLTPVPREGYELGAPAHGFWRELVNTDAAVYGGSGVGNLGGATTRPVSRHGRPCSLTLTLPPLATLLLRHEPEELA